MELLTDDIIKAALEADGFIEEPDAPWLLEYIETEYGGKLDTSSSWCEDKGKLKIYSESTADSYDIYWCTHDERPYVSQDGYHYEDHNEWSDRAVEELTSGCDVWVSPDIWSDMEYDFNYILLDWWPDVYEDMFKDKKDELLDSGEYTVNEKDE